MTSFRATRLHHTSIDAVSPRTKEPRVTSHLALDTVDAAPAQCMALLIRTNLWSTQIAAIGFHHRGEGLLG
jgi:hypothetical protein